MEVRWEFLSLKFHCRSQLPDTELAPQDVQLVLKEGKKPQPWGRRGNHIWEG